MTNYKELDRYLQLLNTINENKILNEKPEITAMDQYNELMEKTFTNIKTNSHMYDGTDTDRIHEFAKEHIPIGVSDAGNLRKDSDESDMDLDDFADMMLGEDE
jgi:hypothetical protein